MQQNDDQAPDAFCRANGIPRGHRYTLVLISIVKRALEGDTPGEFRLQFLEHLDRMPGQSTNSWCSAEVIASVEPICNKGWEIVNEARKLGPNKALDIYADQFSTFAALNPSLMTALKLSSTTARSL